MEQIIAQMLPGLLSSLVTACAGALAGYLAGRRKEAKAEDKNVKIAVKALLRGQVMDLGLHYISKGYIPPYGLETLRNYYDPYVALGDGDPSIKHIVETCESLTVHSGEMEENTRRRSICVPLQRPLPFARSRPLHRRPLRPSAVPPFWGLLTGVSLSAHPPLLACCLC